MNYKELFLGASLLLIGFQSTYAAECQPNGLGGSFCINEDGTTSDSIPNEVDGQETYTDNGTLSSSSPTEDGNDQMLSGSDPSNSTDTMSNTLNSKVDRKDDPLIGQSWNKPSNLNGDGAATSSMDMLN
ncbi:RND transporter [Raoultella terrigena]|uniref:RND transporter n=1 Tax=Raoultella terrigena TaxID=577 RepID=UPI001F2DC3C7|nr:RND transporter [Raoultella terrigena]MCE9899649.1 RND transporter [Raoultella terrigena]